MPLWLGGYFAGFSVQVCWRRSVELFPVLKHVLSDRLWGDALEY